MKGELQDQLILAPRTERAILDEIRNDRELIARLRVTPQELEALSKCALLGTLTCKQDMLFILRQIREATSPDIDHATISPSRPCPRSRTKRILSRISAVCRHARLPRSFPSQVRSTVSFVPAGPSSSEFFSGSWSWWWA